MEDRKERITDGKALMDIVTGATRWELNRDELDSEDAEDYVDKLNGKILFCLKNWNRFFDEDRKSSEIGMTMDLADIKSHGYSIVASVAHRKSADPEVQKRYSAVLRVVKD